MARVSYDHTAIEEKWQNVWASLCLFQDTQRLEAQQKEYLLFAFAYPSGSGLHVGHVESKTALDIMARFLRMNGKNVYFPVGWDAFGLPAENYAIKTGTPPAQTTRSAIDTFRRQIQRLGISYDWDNEIATNHPEYYRWTQWLFLQLYKKGLAYQGLGMVNWCPSCQTVLANEQVVNGRCERCDSLVEQRELKQWYFKITQYKDELLSGLDEVDWPEATKQQQKHWIGKAQGLSIDFTLKAPESSKGETQKLTVWTKFWETVYGVTFVVMAPEAFEDMKLLEKVPSEKQAVVKAYLDQAKHKTEEERRIGEKDKTGVDTGLFVVNPVNGQEVPLFVADYVLMGVGTAVVMGVPAHDERDFAFAQKYSLPVKQVVSYPDEALNEQVSKGEKSVEAPGTLIHSGQFDGMDAWGDGKQAMVEWMISQGFAAWQTTYKLRDWLISRQRYWGAPIPIVYDPQGNPHPVKEEHLPWKLPEDVDFKPTGESPLKSSQEFLKRTEELYGKGWTPEFDTMDTFVDSSWYFLRYCDARNTQVFADSEKLAGWLPVDLYLIGPEHIVLHLLYSRFFTKFLRDEGYLKISEPFFKMRHQGMILGPDGKKMSKSKGNVINPDEIVAEFGADTLRVYEMFMGPLEADKPWDPRAVAGVSRFLKRVYGLVQAQPAATSHPALQRKLHQTVKKVTEDIPQLKFNTSIAMMMEFTNLWEELVAQERAQEQATGGQGKTGVSKQGEGNSTPEGSGNSVEAPLTEKDIRIFLALLAPFAPFLAEELFSLRGGAVSSKDTTLPYEGIHVQPWPQYDPSLTVEEMVSLAVQVNGKVRAQLQVAADSAADKATVLAAAKELPEVQKWLGEKKVLKEIFVPKKIVSFVV